MPKIKFQSKVTNVSDQKCNDIYIDSGATLRFFHSKSSFIAYERIDPESVKSASSTSKLVGKKTIKLLFDNGTMIEGYHAPKFLTNVISVRFLLETHKAEFSENEQGTPFCYIYQKESNIFMARIQEEDLLFPFKLRKLSKSLKAKKQLKYFPLEDWSRKTRHLSAERYYNLSETTDPVPKFGRASLLESECTPCKIAKTQRATVKSSSRRT